MRYPTWLNREEYPFESHYIDLPMGRMHYVDEGQGAPLVMLHGNPGWSFEYRNVIKAMAKTHRCIAPDYIGFGLSDKPYGWDYLPASHANNLEHLLESLPLEGITLVVNDWGGPIGLSYAIRHPQKIKQLVVLNTWLWSVKHDLYYRAFSAIMGGALGKLMIKHFNIFGKVVVPLVVGDKKLPPDIHRHYYKHLATRKDRKGCYVFPQQIVASGDWLDSLWQQREKITHIPTTIIWGMKDKAFRVQELNHWTTHWNNPKVIRLDSVGHFPQEEDPTSVIEVLSI